MDVPGLSLFQGGESLKINSSLQRIEEEEAIEDQKRRNEEVFILYYLVSPFILVLSLVSVLYFIFVCILFEEINFISIHFFLVTKSITKCF